MFSSVVEAVFYYSGVAGEKLCLADDNGSLSYSEYKDKICRYAACFAGMGIKNGVNIIVESNQTVDYLAIELALHLVGAVFVPVEHNCTKDKIQYFIERTNAKAVIVNHSDFYGNCQCYTYVMLDEMSSILEPFSVKSFPERDDVSEILFSTGTTGREKGIVLTHKSSIALAQNVMFGVGMKEDNIEMIPSPMNHSHGLRRYYANMYNGSSVILLGSVMDLIRFFKNMDNYCVNSLDLVPSALSVVLKLSKNKLSEYKKQLRYIQLGSAPLLENDKKMISSLLPDTDLYNFYGSTESGCTCIYNFNNSSPKPDCIGKPTRNTDIIVVDENRNPIASSKNCMGYLATKGSMNMLGYWEDEAETFAVLAENTVYSNDIGYIDDEGDIILIGRKGDVINVGGCKVSPEEIENAARMIPGIVDCGCIPLPDKDKGEVPKLFVQMAENEEFDPIALRSFLAKKLEPYKVPKFIEEIEKIPRSFNGKLLRKQLKQ